MSVSHEGDSEYYDSDNMDPDFEIEFLEEDKDVVYSCFATNPELITKEEPTVKVENQEAEEFKTEVELDEVYDEIVDIKKVTINLQAKNEAMEEDPEDTHFGLSAMFEDPSKYSTDLEPHEKPVYDRQVTQAKIQDYANVVPPICVNKSKLSELELKRLSKWGDAVKAQNKKDADIPKSTETSMDHVINTTGMLHRKTIYLNGKFVALTEILPVGLPPLAKNKFKFKEKNMSLSPKVKKDYVIQKDIYKNLFVYNKTDGFLDRIYRENGITTIKYEKTVCNPCKGTSMTNDEPIKIKLRCPICCSEVTKSDEFITHVDTQHTKEECTDKKYLYKINFVTRTLKENEKTFLKKRPVAPKDDSSAQTAASVRVTKKDSSQRVPARAKNVRFVLDAHDERKLLRIKKQEAATSKNVQKQANTESKKLQANEIKQEIERVRAKNVRFVLDAQDERKLLRIKKQEAAPSKNVQKQANTESKKLQANEIKQEIERVRAKNVRFVLDAQDERKLLRIKKQEAATSKNVQKQANTESKKLQANEIKQEIERVRAKNVRFVLDAHDERKLLRIKKQEAAPSKNVQKQANTKSKNVQKQANEIKQEIEEDKKELRVVLTDVLAKEEKIKKIKKKKKKINKKIFKKSLKVKPIVKIRPIAIPKRILKK